jgi:allantoin racemase
VALADPHLEIQNVPARSPKLALVMPVAESAQFLRKIRADYDPSRLGVRTTFIFPASAPAAIESADDARAADAGVRDAVAQAVDRGADAVLVTCFSDPGVRSAAAAVDVPVLGEGRPTIAATGALFDRFSVLSAMSSTVDAKEQMVTELGLADRLQAVVGLDIPVQDLTPARAATVAAIVAAQASDGAQAVILGCTGFQLGFTAAVRREVRALGASVAVIDPAEVAGRAIVAAAISSGAPR